MPSSEFVVLAGMIIVGLIIFMIVEFFIAGEQETVSEYGYKAEAEGLVSLIERVSLEPNEYVLDCQYISPCDISVKNGILTYVKDEIKYSFSVPESVNVTNLKRVATVCVLKSGDTINLLSKKPICIIDGFCIPDECKEDCPDCTGPNPICINDGFCNKYLKEDCSISNLTDCSCSSNKVCCPTSSDSDGNGCSSILGLDEGQNCWCSLQCKSNLYCNPTVPDFTDYEKACCPVGYGWNGTGCEISVCPVDNLCPNAHSDGGPGDNAWTDANGKVCCPLSNIDDTSGPVCSFNHCCPTHKPKWCNNPLNGEPKCMSNSEYNNDCKPEQVYVITFIPVSYSDLNEFNSRATFMKDFVEKTLPFRENPDTLVILIGNQNCPTSEYDSNTLMDCGYNLAISNGYPDDDLTGGIFGVCVGGDGCPDGTGPNILGYTQPGAGWFIAGYDTCTVWGCPSIQDSVVAPHEIGHNFRLCEGYCYSGGYSCYSSERSSFGGYCGTSRIEQKFPNQRSATGSRPCGGCGPSVCCFGRILDNDPINSLNGGRDVMGPGQNNPNRDCACDSYLAFKDVAVNVYNFDLPPVTDLDIQTCYNHIQGDTHP